MGLPPHVFIRLLRGSKPRTLDIVAVQKGGTRGLKYLYLRYNLQTAYQSKTSGFQEQEARSPSHSYSSFLGICWGRILAKSLFFFPYVDIPRDTFLKSLKRE